MTSVLRAGPRRRGFGWVLAAFCFAAAWTPASAPAAVTVGQVAPNSASVNQCGGGTVFVQHQVAAPPAFTIPAEGGVVTAWSVQGGNTPSEQLNLKLVRQAADGTSYTVVGQDTFRPITQGVLNTFATRIPVTGGEVLSLFFPPPSADCYFTGTSGDAVRFLLGIHPEPGIGETFQTDSQFSGRLNLSATLEPDCDADGFGDETQDPNLFGGSCPPKGRSLTLDAHKNKVKKGKKVLLSGHLDAADNEQACESAQAVDLQRKRPSQTTFTTFEQLQTDAQGSFSTRKKVKKTFQYRAQVAETSTCGAGLSDTEKVKVKKR